MWNRNRSKGYRMESGVTMSEKKIVKVLDEEIYGENTYIEDVTDEEWYKDPKITLYDELEQDTHELICDYVKLIGVHLNKEDCGDYHLTMKVRDFIIDQLEKEFGISFPVANEG